MSTTEEIINAQRGAFEHKESFWWHRHLIGPEVLEHYIRSYEEQQKITSKI